MVTRPKTTTIPTYCTGRLHQRKEEERGLSFLPRVTEAEGLLVARAVVEMSAKARMLLASA